MKYDVERLISYSGEAQPSEQVFDVALFRQLNEEFRDKPVVPAPRRHDTAYTTEIGRKRCEMLDRKIGIRDARVLELGCGDGMLSRVMARDFGCDVVGVDIQSYESWSRPAEGRLKQVVHDVTKLDNAALGTFDRAVSFAVLEHVVHPHAAFRALFEMLKPGGKAYVYANLYRGAKASHRYREVFFPWAHLLFQASVWREFYRGLTGEPMQSAWVNKLTYDQYVNMAGRVGFRVVEHFPSAPYFNEEFYARFNDELAAYPKFDLMHDFIHLVLEKPRGEADDGETRRLLAYPPSRDGSDDQQAGFWASVASHRPEWSIYRERWLASRRGGATAIGDALPWVTFPAIDFLDARLGRGHRVFEWGSGGSTRFFLARAGEVVSIEHDAAWFGKVHGALRADGRLTQRLVEPAREAPADWRFASGSPGCLDMSFETYVRSVEVYEDGYFDLVVVDGRARMGCLALGHRKVAPGGWLLLDNANYPRYREKLTLLRRQLLAEGWVETVLAGPGPYSRTPAWETLVWQRPGTASRPAPLARRRPATVRDALRDRPVRPYDRISYVERPKADIARIMAGEAFTQSGFTYRMDDVLDWRLEERPRSQQLFMHSWDPLEPFFAAFSDTGDPAVLQTLCTSVLEWLRRFGGELRDIKTRRAPSGDEEFTTYDTAVSSRFFRLSYLIAAAATSPLLGDSDFTELVDALRAHAQALAPDQSLASHSNHGVLQALAQICGASRLLQAEQHGATEAGSAATFASAFRQGCGRLAALLKEQVTEDGAHKEHSPAYHLMLTSALDWIASQGIVQDEKLEELLSKMREVGRWMYDPEGRIANLGDTDLQPRFARPDFEALDAGRECSQALFGAGGYWFVKGTSRRGGTYLAQACAFHSRVHKQADSGAFTWHDRGRDILIDAGRYGYSGRTQPGSPLFLDGFWYSDPKRVYVEGTRAHNTVEIDGRNHRRYRQPALGGTITGAVEQDGIFASRCVVANAGPGAHQRFLAVNPGEWLAVFDTCRFTDEPRHVRQWFHMHPDWAIAKTGGRLVASAGDAQISILAPIAHTAIGDVVSGEIHAPADALDPGYLGWWSRDADLFEPCSSFSVGAQGKFVTVATLFMFGDLAASDCRCVHNVTHRSIKLSWMKEGVAKGFTLTSSGLAHNEFSISLNSN